jgi:hypothetical protein
LKWTQIRCSEPVSTGFPGLAQNFSSGADQQRSKGTLSSCKSPTPPDTWSKYSSLHSSRHSALLTGTLNINNEAIGFLAIATILIENQETQLRIDGF